MALLTSIDPETATGRTKELLDGLGRRLTRVPEMIRVMANSPAVLDAYLHFNEMFERTRLAPRLRGLITVIVSEIDGCAYTLAVASALGQRDGITEAEFRGARRGESADPRTAAALQFAAALVHERGGVPPAAVERLRAAGFDDQEIVEVIAIVALNVFRNYFNIALNTTIDFPPVPTSQAQSAGQAERLDARAHVLSRRRGDGVS